MRKIINYIDSPIKLTILNLVLVIAICLGNYRFQVFCIPVLWAAIVFTVCMLFTCFFPLIETKTKYLPIFGFINGISSIVLLYIILFLAEMNFFGVFLILLLGFGLLTYVPHFLLTQLIWKSLIKPKHNCIRKWYVSGIMVALVSIGISVGFYKNALEKVEKLWHKSNDSIELDYFTERIMGAHFLYHTKIETYYDGWRPPMHDPLFVMCLWATHFEDPLDSNEYHAWRNFEQRILFYKKYYPNNPIKLDCSCAMQYSNWYHQDSIWQKLGLR